MGETNFLPRYESIHGLEIVHNFVKPDKKDCVLVSPCGLGGIAEHLPRLGCGYLVLEPDVATYNKMREQFDKNLLNIPITEFKTGSMTVEKTILSPVGSGKNIAMEVSSAISLTNGKLFLILPAWALDKSTTDMHLIKMQTVFKALPTFVSKPFKQPVRIEEKQCMIDMSLVIMTVKK